MFSSILFKTIACPNRADCKLQNCLFSHEPPTITPTMDLIANTSTSTDVGRENGDLKRRRLNNSSIEHICVSSEDIDPATKKTTLPSSSPLISSSSTTPGSTSTMKLPTSATRPVSPPPLKAISKTAPASKSAPNGSSAIPSRPTPAKAGKIEQLTPRMVRSGGPYQQRLLLLKALHTELVRLNSEVKNSADDKIQHLLKDRNELVSMALDLEEQANSKGGGLYRGMMSQKVAYYKKMNLDAWVKDLRVAIAKEKQLKDQPLPPEKRPVKIETGLTRDEELEFAERFALSPQQMGLAEYILTPPTDQQITNAIKTQESMGGHETCDRCSSRFKVLSAMDKATGSWTTNGRCVYHWGKFLFPKSEKVDAQVQIGGKKEGKYTCCSQSRGSPGCTTQMSHVFKINPKESGRLASILQFATTPVNTAKVGALAFDCEMGYTTVGLEMIRLSACKWPSGEALIDVLVKPIGEILDLNSRFSGVTPRQMADAQLLKPNATPLRLEDGPMPIVPGPAAARDLLTSFISPTTPLIAHAAENDLNVLRLIHPTIIDTALLYPHHMGLPFRHALRILAKEYLNIDIQAVHSSAGHDSMEDSRVTGELVRVKVEREWKELMKMGWSRREGRWWQRIGNVEKEKELPKYTKSQGWAKKRKGDDGGSGIGGYVSETVGLGSLVKEQQGK